MCFLPLAATCKVSLEVIPLLMPLLSSAGYGVDTVLLLISKRLVCVLQRSAILTRFHILIYKTNRVRILFFLFLTQPPRQQETENNGAWVILPLKRNEHIPAGMSVCVRMPVHTCARVCVHVCPCGCVVPTFLAQTVACSSRFSQPCLSYGTTHPGGSAGQHAEGSPPPDDTPRPPGVRPCAVSPGHMHGARPQCRGGSRGPRWAGCLARDFLPPGTPPHTPSGKPACGAGGRRAEGSRVSASRGRTSRRGLGAWPLSCCTHRPVCEARAGAVRTFLCSRGAAGLSCQQASRCWDLSWMQIPDPEQQRSLNTWECRKTLSGGGV